MSDRDALSQSTAETNAGPIPPREEGQFPSTRYQGSKRQVIDQIWQVTDSINFDSIIEVFGGTGVFSYKAKTQGKRAVYNDFLKFNHQIGMAIIENSSVRINQDELLDILTFDENIDYPSFIQDEFEGIYFKDEENEWLDCMRVNIMECLDNKYKRAIAWAALSQACLAKRPYNLFHRANLYMRTNDVERSFGNKKTWERNFEELFRRYINEFNEAVFFNGRENKAYNEEITQWNPPIEDLAYIDPPFYSKHSSNPVTDYVLYYHFLEGYLNYDEWADMIDDSVKTKAIQHDKSPWNNPEEITKVIEDLFEYFSDSHILMSYNTNALPTPSKVISRLKSVKDNVETKYIDHEYALSNPGSQSEELVILGYDT